MKAKIFLLFFYLTLTLSIYGQTYPGTQVSNPVRTYVQNDTKGVWVIGNGAPIFSPTAKMSQLYFDYMNQTGYFWNGSTWVAWTNDFLRTASNGLTEDGTDVKLGGDLDENTTIDLDGFEFVIQGPGTLGFDITGDIALLSTGGVEIRPDGKFEVHTLQNIEVDATQDIYIQTDDVINIQAVNGGSIIADNNDFVLEATLGNIQINSPATTAGVVNGITYKSDVSNSLAVTDYGINTTTGGMADDGKVWTYNGTANEMELVTPTGVDGLAAGTGISFSGAAPDITISATGDITPYTVTAPITLTGHDIGHTASGVTPGTYGSQIAAAVVTVDATGHVTGATTTTIIPGTNTIGANQLTSGLRDSITVNNWNILGNTGTNDAVNFIGTNDDEDVVVKRNNLERIRVTNNVVEINAGIKIVDGSEAAYRYLQSDAVGNGTWVDAIPPNVQVFTATATYTPSTGMMYCRVQVQAAGGGSGGTSTTAGGEASLGFPGGGGGYSEGYFTYVDIGASKLATVGAGGTAGTGGGAGTAGGNGGSSSLGSLIVCAGGTGGTTFKGAGGGGGAGGTGGAVSTSGDVIAIKGGAGTVSTTVGRFAGNGGESFLGHGGIGVSSVGAGANPEGYGAGGGGIYIGASTTGVAGVAGTDGIIIITEYF